MQELVIPNNIDMYLISLSSLYPIFYVYIYYILSSLANTQDIIV